MMATASYDSVKVWKIDFSSQQERLDVKCSLSIPFQNVSSLLILPGNKNLVLGTKEGVIALYDLQSNEVI